MPAHWIAAPIVLPLLAGCTLVLLARRGLAWQRWLSVAVTLAGALLAAWLFVLAGEGVTGTYRLGDWPPPFGIVLVFDRLAALLVLLTSVLALCSVLHAVHGADREGTHYHALFQLQLVGLNGAFLTGDLFNLFVFFEILLIASYCLLVFGGTPERLRAGIHYVVLNLTGSALFLVAVGTLYGVTGTLNLADMSTRVAALEGGDVALVQAAGLLLLVVFALKAALVPLYFWLPNAYAAASAPVAALFAIMTKVGIYAIVRVYTLVFGPAAGGGADLAGRWLLPAALLTVFLAACGALACRQLRRMAGYLLILSVGVMLAGVATFESSSLAAALFYMVQSTLGMAALYLIVDLISRQRGAVDDLLVPARPVEQPALLGALFFTAAVAVAGMPPLAGFLGKAWILAVAPGGAATVWIWSVVLSGSLVSIVTLARAGGVLFWQTDSEGAAPAAARIGASAVLPAAGLLVAILALSALAGGFSDYTRATADDLLTPATYVETVLGGAP